MRAEAARPYAAAYTARFIVMLQYRAAAIAGFATQCWWGAIKVMIYAAFYRASPAAAGAPITLPEVISYTWLAQGFLALAPWACDPEIALAVRTGAIGQDGLRPVDMYALWYARAAGWMTSRALPRAALMFIFAGGLLPLIGLGEWSLRLPPSVAQAALFAVSLVLAVTLATAITMLLNLGVIVTLNDRGINSIVSPFVIVLSGNLIPLAIFPDWGRGFLFVQPFAGVVDIPFRIYTGSLYGMIAFAGIALQLAWTVALIGAGRLWTTRVMHRLEIQGG